MQKKSSKLPVNAYVAKWLRNRVGYNHSLELAAPIAPLVRPTPTAVYNHFRRADLVDIVVIGYYPNKAHLYSLHKALEAQFNCDLLSEMKIGIALNGNAREALASFMRKCKIEEEELSIETAYKRWQRGNKIMLHGIKIN